MHQTGTKSTLKKVRFLRNPQKRLIRPEKASERIQMPKKRILNSTEPFAKKPIFSPRNLKISFVKKIRNL